MSVHNGALAGQENRNEDGFPVVQENKPLKPHFEAEIAKRLAETEKTSHDEAKRIAVEVASKAVLVAAKQISKQAKVQLDES